MADTKQKFIDDLITVIMDAEASESVTNEMVARVFDFLNKGYKDLLTNNSAVETEKSERQAADAALQRTIDTLQLALQTATRTASDAQTAAVANRTAINNILGKNASTAIENFNEILIFLAGVSDDENLVKKLTELKSLVNTETSNREDSIAEVENSLNIHRKSSSEQFSAHSRRLDALENKAIMPIAGIADTVADLATLPDSNEEVYYVREKRQFRHPGCFSSDEFTEDSQTLGVFYNSGNTAREDALYCDGMTFYHFVDETEDEGGGLLRMASSTDIRDINSDIRYLREDHERDLAEHYDHVGVVGFEAIVDEHPSVMPGGTLPEVTDGMAAHVIFDRSRGTFLWEIHDVMYECPQGDAWQTWPRATEFLDASLLPRTDRIFRCGPTLYRYDGTGLKEIGSTYKPLQYKGRCVSLVKMHARHIVHISVHEDPSRVYGSCGGDGNRYLHCELNVNSPMVRPQIIYFYLPQNAGISAVRIKGGKILTEESESGRVRIRLDPNAEPEGVSELNPYGVTTLSFELIVEEHNIPSSGLFRLSKGFFIPVGGDIMMPAAPAEAATKAKIMSTYNHRKEEPHERQTGSHVNVYYGIPLSHSKRLQVEQCCLRPRRAAERDDDYNIVRDEKGRPVHSVNLPKQTKWRKIHKGHYQNCTVKTYRARLKYGSITGPWVYFRLVKKFDGCGYVKFT